MPSPNERLTKNGRFGKVVRRLGIAVNVSCESPDQPRRVPASAPISNAEGGAEATAKNSKISAPGLLTTTKLTTVPPDAHVS